MGCGQRRLNGERATGNRACMPTGQGPIASFEPGTSAAESPAIEGPPHREAVA